MHTEQPRRGNSNTMGLLIVLLLLAGAICFALAAFGVAARVNLVAAGLLCWILTVLIPAFDRLA